MPHDLTLDTPSSETLMEKEVDDVTYQEKLKFWAIARILPGNQHTIVARYRTHSDANGYLKFFRERLPKDNLTVLYAPYK